MGINTEQTKTLTGASNTILLNGDCTYLQVTIYGRNTGTVTPTVRPLLEKNAEADFLADEFEGVEDGAIDLSVSPRKRTFTVEVKRLSALKLADSGSGTYKAHIRQWGRANN